MTNPSETELVRRWQDIRARMEAVPEDTPYIDVFADAVEWAADAIQAADTIDRLTSTGAVEVPHYSSKDAEFDRLLALGTAEAGEFLTWLKANPGETLSPFAQRALAHTFGFIMDKAASPREGHVEVPVEPTEVLWIAFSMEYAVEGYENFAKAYRAMLSALPHSQGETKPMPDDGMLETILPGPIVPEEAP